VSELANALLRDSDELSNDAVRESVTEAERSLYGAGSKVGRSDYTVGDDGNYYNGDGERVYYWVRPRETNSTFSDTGAETGSIGMDRGGYYTEAEIKSAWDADEGMGYFKKQTDWDSYWGFLTERQGLIQSGEMIDPTSDAFTSDEYGTFTSDLDPTGTKPADNVGSSFGGRDEEKYYAKLDASKADVSNQRMGQFVDENSELMAKYGIEPVIQNKDGDTFLFNGSTYVRTEKIDDHGHYGQLIGGALMGLATAGTVAPLITSAAGGLFGATPAGLVGPPTVGNVIGGKLAAGFGAAGANAVTQGIMTGSVDPRSALTSGLMAGLNPGGMLTDKLGVVPNNVVGGFLSGAVNEATAGLINGDFDVTDVLMAGFKQGGINAVMDFLSDADQFSLESEMKRIAEDNPNMTEAEVFAAASKVLTVGTSDLAGLIGKDGLLPFIDRVPTEWLTNLMGGAQEFQLNQRYRGPDGKIYTDIEMMEKFPEIDLDAVKDNAWISSLDDETNYNGWSTYEVTQAPTALGEMFDRFKELPGVSNITEFINNGIDAAARQQFIATYGFDPADPANYEQTKLALLYGPLDETYNFSSNPRGDSEVIGVLQGFKDKYSTGPDWGKYQTPDGTPLFHVINFVNRAVAAGSDPAAIIASLGDNANMVLPGSDTTLGDALLQGILDGLNTDNGGDNGGDIVDDNNGDTVLDNSDPRGPDWKPTGPGNEDPRGPNWKPNGPGEELDNSDPRGPNWKPNGPPPELPPPPPPPPQDLPPDIPPELTKDDLVLSGGDVVLPGGGFGIDPELMGGDFTMTWGELFPYTTLTEPEKAKLAPYKDYIEQARGMLS